MRSRLLLAPSVALLSALALAVPARAEASVTDDVSDYVSDHTACFAGPWRAAHARSAACRRRQRGCRTADRGDADDRGCSRSRSGRPAEPSSGSREPARPPSQAA